MWNQTNTIWPQVPSTKHQVPSTKKSQNTTPTASRAIWPACEGCPAGAGGTRREAAAGERDARCARVSSASSAPTPAPGAPPTAAFPLVRDHCHHQFAPPGAFGVPQADWAWCLYRDNTCELFTDCQSRVAPIYTRSLPCSDNSLAAPELKSWNRARGLITKRRPEAISEQVRHHNQKRKMKPTIVNC